MISTLGLFIIVPVLAAPFQGMVAAVLMLIAFIGWIVNLINSQNHPPPPARRRRPNSDRSRTVQDDIDQFLSEARRSRKEQRRRNGGNEPGDGVEVIGPGQSRRRPPSPSRKSREEIWREQTGGGRRRPPQAAAAAPQQQDEPPPVRRVAVEAERLGEAISARHAIPLAKANEIANHVQQRMASRLAAQVERDLPHAMDAAVAADLGTFTAELPTSIGQQGYFESRRRDPAGVVRLRTLLRQRQGLRNAIIVNEILSPPVSRRRK